MSDVSLELWLSLVAVSVAIGFSLYAALALPGLAAHLGLLRLPEPLAGLSAPSVWSVLLVLSFVEAMLSRHRTPDLVWNALHTFVRPMAALIFAAAAFHGAGVGAAWIPSAGALIAAFLTHVSACAVHSAAFTAGPHSPVPGFTAVQIGTAAGLGVLAWMAPLVAAALAAVALLAPLPWWPRLWGAAALPLRALYAAARGAGRPRAWRSGKAGLPRWARSFVAAHSLPADTMRWAPVTLARLGPRWPYLHGRIIVGHQMRPLIIYRRGLRSGVVRLEGGSGRGRADHGVLVETLELEDRRRCAICVGPDAPGGPAILAALTDPWGPVEPGMGAGFKKQV